MIVYWSLFLVPATLSVLEYSNSRGRVSIGFAGCLIALFLAIGFRETGGDWSTYLAMFQSISYLSIEGAASATDPIYGVLNWASSQLGAGMYGVNVVSGIIYLWGFSRLALRESRPLLMLAVSVPYLVIVVMMGYNRQGIAIGILLWAITCLYDKRPLTYTVLCLLAAGFHKTAIVMLPLVYFGVNLGAGRLVRLAQVIAIMSGLFFTLREQFSVVDVLWANYVESDHYQSQGAVLRSVMSAGAAVLLFYYWKSWKALWPDRALWTTLSLASLAAVPLSFVASTAVDRMSLYLIPVQLVVFTRLPALQKTRGGVDIAIMGTVAAYAAALGIWLHLGQFAGVLWLPYKSLLIGEIP